MSSSELSQIRSENEFDSSGKDQFPDPNPLSCQTPEKPPPLSHNVRKRNLPLSSIKEAINPQRTHDRIDEIRSSRRKINLWSDERPVSESKNRTDVLIELPERYEVLSKFFDSLDSVIRLLKLKGSSSSFTNIIPKMECFTKRKFSYDHLAQMMFILPEAIEIKKILVLDEQTNCMKPDLHVVICPDELSKEEKTEIGFGNMCLRRLFRKRILEFVNSHPEVEEAPKVILTEPFNHSSQDPYSKPTNAAQGEELVRDLIFPTTIETDGQNQQKLANASHISQHFCQRFSKKRTNEEESIHKLSKLQNHCSTADNAKYSESCVSLPGLPSSLLLPTPSKETGDMTHNPETESIHSTPAKLALTPEKLMIHTPAIAPPNKSCISPNDDESTTLSSPNKLVRRSSKPRSLKFDTLMEDETSYGELDNSTSVSLDNDTFDVLPQTRLHSIRGKERTKEENLPIPEGKKGQTMSSRLPKLLDMISSLSKSIKRQVMTKEELLYKIISGNSEIVDKREVEEQLSLLLKLFPNWISQKEFGGDMLLCIDKVSGSDVTWTCLDEAR